MTFFDEVNQKLDEFILKLDATKVASSTKTQANDLADEVLANAEAMGGGIIGDIDDTLLKKARIIKQKLSH